MDQDAGAFHGGAFWDCVGPEFEDLTRMSGIVPADVLDAWFPPAPGCLQSLRENLELCCRSSPPVTASGLVEAISKVRVLPHDSIVLGPGSSSLIFLALRHWLTADSKVLILDPMYGEYAHVLSNVVGCRHDVLPLHRSNGYQVDLDELVDRGACYDWILLVNPNSPTGAFVQKRDLASAIRELPDSTNVWIDEAYIEYVGAENSLESEVARSSNVVVCKSLSKSYALSGLRAAYLVAPPHRATELRRISAPWCLSLPGQLAAVRALQDPTYYERRYQETHDYRRSMLKGLRRAGLDVLDGSTNSLLVHLEGSLDTMLEECRNRGVLLRNVDSMFRKGSPNALRIAVRTPQENALILEALCSAASHVAV